MKRIFIGHRGVGKTTLLIRHQSYYPHVKHVDLDGEIERTTGTTIQNLFNTQGESKFRHLELGIFHDLYRHEKEFVMSVGAGFPLEKLPSDCEIVFVARLSDQQGRIFLNRPRLDLKLSPLEESLSRYIARQPKYLEASQIIYHLPEGIEKANSLERQILRRDYFITDAIYTLTKNEIPSVDFLKKNFSQIELRSDLLDMNLIGKLIDGDPDYPWLQSIRTECKPVENVRTDLDIRWLGNSSNAMIISCHSENIEESLSLVEKYSSQFEIKISPMVESFAELVKGYEWQRRDPARRNFLPRSKSGKWIWYRQLSKFWQKINFVRCMTDLSDQPSIYQWLTLPQSSDDGFGAVLGSPVLFSRSPEIHREFMGKRNSFFTAIDISAEELRLYLPWLQSLGLKYAAVTSPHKRSVYERATFKTDTADSLRAANTLYLSHTELCAHNTDDVGFKSWINEMALDPKSSVAVWGGGGTLNMLKSNLPQANFFSAREPVTGAFDPSVVIWAAPRTAETRFPPEQWNPNLVIDLNYQENSMGIEYAKKKNCSYISGLGMFKAQAAEQQKYWSQQ